MPLVTTAYGKTATHPDATAVSPSANFLMRFEQTLTLPADLNMPTTPPENLRIRTGSNPESYETYVPTLTFLRNSKQRSTGYANAEIPSVPAGDPTIYLEILEPATSNILPPDDSLGPEKLKVRAGHRVPANLLTYGDEEFSSVPPAGLREIYSGSRGVTVTSASASVVPANLTLDGDVDLDEENHGILSGGFVLSLTNMTSQSISFTPGADNVTHTATVNGWRTLQEIGAAAVYNGTTNLGAKVLIQPVYLGTTLLGNAVFYVPHNASNELSGPNLGYIASAGHSQSTMGFTVSGPGRMFIQDSGAQARGHDDAEVEVFENANPALAGYDENDVTVVKKGTDRGVWVKDIDETHTTADAQSLAGKSVDPETAGLIELVHGDYTYQYYAPAHDDHQYISAEIPAIITFPAGGTFTGAPTNLRLLVLYATAPATGATVVQALAFYSSRQNLPRNDCHQSRPQPDGSD